MPSPFPGMDPYIEARREWPDFHAGLACELRARLNAVLQVNYYATTTTYIIDDMMDEVRLTNVEVRKTGTHRLVTALEILSPAHKHTGVQRERYLQKRQALFRSTAHIMELDLLRSGQRSPLVITPPPAPYYVLLARAISRPYVDLWPIQLQEPLPQLPIPLHAPDPDVVLDLGAVVRDVYERGAYSRRIDYAQPVPPPELTAEQQVWVDDLLATYRR